MFRHSNWTSFLRQLHLHGFKTIHEDSVSGHAFKHADFQRDNPSLMARIQKQKRTPKEKATKSSQISQEALEEMQEELVALRSQIESMAEAVQMIAATVRDIETSRRSR